MKKHLFIYSWQQGVFFSITLAFVLFFGLGSYFYFQFTKLTVTEQKIEFLKNSLAKQEQKNSANQAIRNQFASADPYFLQNTLGKLPLLQKEKKALESFFKKAEFSGHPLAQMRYQLICNPANALCFAPLGTPLILGGIQEALETTVRPVEIDEEDLKEILSIIDGKQPNQPQLLVSDFFLKKKQKELGGEVYELSLKLLKRDFLHG